MAEAMGATRADVRKFDRVFGRTLIPMALVDDTGAHVDANRPARLLAGSAQVRPATSAS